MRQAIDPDRLVVMLPAKEFLGLGIPSAREQIDVDSTMPLAQNAPQKLCIQSPITRVPLATGQGVGLGVVHSADVSTREL